MLMISLIVCSFLCILFYFQNKKRKRNDDEAESRSRPDDDVGSSIEFGSGTGFDYQVFLSFRGPDTRHGFTDCLYESMMEAGIRVFLDDEELRKGEKISEGLARAIDNSKVYIPIFSKGYASSAWCLRELTMIVDITRGSNEKHVIPIFYDVDPNDVKLRTDLYPRAIKGHKRRFGTKVVDKWAAALQEVARIKGWDLKHNQGQGRLIRRIIEEVTTKLKIRHRDLPHPPIGIDEQLEAILVLLDCGSTDVRYIVVHGMGGIGKTTLVEVVFNKICSQFEGSSFLSNVRESSHGNGIVKLQEKLLSDMIKFKTDKIYDAEEGVHEIKQRFCHKKILMVLDDVDDKVQIMNLAGDCGWFGPGSRIMITTRDINCVAIEGESRQENLQFPPKGFYSYEMTEMDPIRALNLFSMHAFGSDSAPPDHIDLSKVAIDIIGKLPLALVVIGSLLYRKNKEFWEATLEKLRKVPNGKVMDTLMISYETLEHEEKQIFLDIACFFTGKEKTNAMYMWEASGFFPKSGINVLVNKSMIKIADNGEIWVHDQLKDLGREIVRRECPEHPGRRSRLWIPEDAWEVMERKQGSEYIVAMNLGNMSRGQSLRSDEFLTLQNLRMLELHGGQFVGDFQILLSKLRWLSWKDCPDSFNATNFDIRNLVVLKISHGDITKDWGGWNCIKMAVNLKVLKLYDCRYLTRTPDLSACLNLEKLIIKGCHSLTDIDSSIGKLDHLIYLTIEWCRHLKVLLEEICSLANLKSLIIDESPDSNRMPDFSLKSLTFVRSFVRKLGVRFRLPNKIGMLASLELLSLQGRFLRNLPDLPGSIGALESLRELNLSYTVLIQLPDAIGSLKNLQVLNVSHTRLRHLPATIGALHKLEELHANSSSIGEIPSEIGGLCSLRILNLSKTCICGLPTSLYRITRLQSLYLTNCEELKELPRLPASLTRLEFVSAEFQEVPNLSNLVNLVHLVLSNGLDTDEVLIDHADATNQVQPSSLWWMGRLGKLETLTLGVTPRAPRARDATR